MINQTDYAHYVISVKSFNSVDVPLVREIITAVSSTPAHGGRCSHVTLFAFLASRITMPFILFSTYPFSFLYVIRWRLSAILVEFRLYYSCSDRFAAWILFPSNEISASMYFIPKLMAYKQPIGL